MNIDEATRSYETWLATQTTVVRPDLTLKHKRMREDVFSFFRATFYRWMQVWPTVCRDLDRTPRVLAVGDLHVENFGTWRDSEGRLIWGINDFDEAHLLPYTNDLVRLAVSAKLAISTGQLALKPRAACDAILSGYVEGLADGGGPFVLAERHRWLRKIATSKPRDHVQFWQNLEQLDLIRGDIPNQARAALVHMMPVPTLPFTVRRRISGLGSLGRPRFVALADWQGGKIAREAKALVSSACVWARGASGSNHIMYQSILTHAVRCCDPFVQLHDNWVVRRLSPYCSRIALTSLPEERDEGKLLRAMGWELANIHLGSQKMVKAVRQDIAKKPADWLCLAMKAMTKATISDWKDWRNARDGS